ncbi:MAG: Rieske 2Fe-2S domain-containing protein [Pseudomonadota bacterium]
MSFHALAGLHELEEGFRRVVRLGNREYLLLHSGGETYLVDRHCPHAASPLERGALGDHFLTCPRHGLCFDLRTGRARQGGNAVLGRYSLAYDGSEIGVDL